MKKTWQKSAPDEKLTLLEPPTGFNVASCDPDTLTTWPQYLLIEDWRFDGIFDGEPYNEQ